MNRAFHFISFILIFSNYSCKKDITPSEINDKLRNSSYNFPVFKRHINRGSLILNDKYHYPIPSKTFLKNQSKNNQKIYLKDIYPPYVVIKKEQTYTILVIKSNDTLAFEIPKYIEIKDPKDPTFKDLLNTMKSKNIFKKDKLVEGYFEADFDTIKIDKKHKLSFYFISSVEFPKNRYNDKSFKILDGCLIFTTKNKIDKYKQNFESKCDSIFSTTTKIKDTFNLEFILKPTIKGDNFYLIKLKEMFYLKTKDSIREIQNSYFFEGKYYVE